ncbi:MAG: CoA transferase [Synergistes sp.]|nr:CoA transferase [Synergistes sp.]
MGKPLEGVLVVDFTIYFAGPSAGKILADWGADVIKVEPVGGEPGRTSGAVMGLRTDEGSNPYWELLNGGKRTISIDMKTPEGHEIMDRLLKRANIFISNCRLSALTRLKLDYETMSAKHPHIIWGHLCGYGHKGAEAGKPGFDASAFWSRSGALLDVADKDGKPLTNPFAMGDIAAGCSLAGGVSACLYKQAVTGRGEKVVTSLFATGIWHAACLVQSTWHGDEWPKSRREPFSPLCNSFCCKDGKWFYISIMEYKRYFAPLCKAAGRADLITDPRFSTEQAIREHCAEFTAIMDEAFSKKDYAEWDRLLIEADIVHDRIAHCRDVASDPQALANEYVYFTHDREGSPELIPATPVQFGDWHMQHRRAPLLGENTDEIMAEFGYGREDIIRLKQLGIIR